jgi:PPOX class probable F420-dependent enzyme
MTQVDTLADGVRPYIDDVNLAHIATILPDGGPHTVPVWVSMHGDRIAFLASPRSRKARNLAADPRVAFSIVQHDRPTAMAHVRGRVVEVLDGDEARTIIDRMSDQYLGTPYPLREDRVVFLVEPEHSFAQDFG